MLALSSSVSAVAPSWTREVFPVSRLVLIAVRENAARNDNSASSGARKRTGRACSFSEASMLSGD